MKGLGFRHRVLVAARLVWTGLVCLGLGACSSNAGEGTPTPGCDGCADAQPDAAASDAATDAAGSDANDASTPGCKSNGECASGYCNHLVGAEGTCTDGMLYCSADDQCVSGHCNNASGKGGQCIDGKNDDKCAEAADCASGKCLDWFGSKVCSDGQDGAACSANSDCASDYCGSKRCKTRSPIGGPCSLPADCEESLTCVTFNIATFGKCTDRQLGSPCSLTTGCLSGTCAGASSTSLGTCT